MTRIGILIGRHGKPVRQFFNFSKLILGLLERKKRFPFFSRKDDMENLYSDKERCKNALRQKKLYANEGRCAILTKGE